MTTIEAPPRLGADQESAAIPTRRHIAAIGAQELLVKVLEPLDKIVDSRKAQVATALALMAYQCYELEAQGHTKEMPWLFRHTLESGAHPMLGFVGAWLGYVVAKKLIKQGEEREWKWVTNKKLCAVAMGGAAISGVVSADIAVETIQQLVIGKDALGYLDQPGETIKDGIAAAAGGGGFVAEHLREHRTTRIAEREFRQDRKWFHRLARDTAPGSHQ